MMESIEKLRNLLDERGVSCQTDYLHVSWRVGPKLYDAVDNFDGTLTVDNLTPEQVIAATLGGGLTYEDYAILLDELGVSERTCRPEKECLDNYSDLTVTVCSNCRVAIDDLEECCYCPNCGAKVVDDELEH